MVKIRFNSLNELYNRLLPALKTRKREIKIKGYEYITSEDIWNFLKESKWQKNSSLSLHQMADDILHADALLIDNYLKNQMKTARRKLVPDETEDIL